MSCPPLNTLKQLISENATDDPNDTVREHVRACTQCQANLDELSDDSELKEWRSSKKRFSDLQETPLDDAPCSESPDASASGDCSSGTLGDYTILGELGRGGMGVVLRAFDSQLKRHVAIKVLRPDRNDPHSRERFVREARAVARIKHENVVTVYFVADPENSDPYLVMESITGPTLRERIDQEEHLGVREAGVILRQIASGLAAAHDQGLVHRDVKPSNIILEDVEENSGSELLRPRAKIMDFGLARQVTSESLLTQSGVILGTPSYMSPEQIITPEDVDRRSDVYGLGVTLYEAITGTVPFRGIAQMVLRQIECDEPVAPRQLNNSIPRDLETICLKAMAKDPRDVTRRPGISPTISVCGSTASPSTRVRSAELRR